MLKDAPSWYVCVATSQQVNTERGAARGSCLSASSGRRRAPQSSTPCVYQIGLSHVLGYFVGAAKTFRPK